MKILVTGGAGFLGSHLCDRLFEDRDNEIFCLDNFYTGQLKNIDHLIYYDRFHLMNQDICDPLDIEVNQIYNLASPAAPGDYNRDPGKTLRTNTQGVFRVLNLAIKLNIPLLQFSTVRVNDINVNGNPYIKGKKEAEIILSSYPKAKIARLHSTIGLRMRSDDSRVIPSFVVKALAGEDIVVYDNRIDHFCFVDDMINEVVKFMNSDEFGIKELGYPFEISILQLAKLVVTITNSESSIILKDLPVRNR